MRGACSRILLLVACSRVEGFSTTLQRGSPNVSRPNVRSAIQDLKVRVAERRINSIRMTETEEPKSPLPLPSVQSLAYAGIAALSAKDLFTSEAIRNWLTAGGAVPFSTIGGNGILLGYSLLQLSKFFGFGKTDYYENLEGLDVASLSSQAGEWALAGEVPVKSKDGQYEVATFAGGCFWGTELHFQRMPGVVATCVGYTQGRLDKPSYMQVCSGTTGHTEGLQMIFDPAVVSYARLCDKLLATVDSTALNRVGNDIGTQYRHGLYPHTDEQFAAAQAAIEREQTKRGAQKVVTEVRRAMVFWPAEKYHQRYLQKGGQSAEKEATAPVRCYG